VPGEFLQAVLHQLAGAAKVASLASQPCLPEGELGTGESGMAGKPQLPHSRNQHRVAGDRAKPAGPPPELLSWPVVRGPEVRSFLAGRQKKQAHPLLLW
jgi:hypothetical protein